MPSSQPDPIFDGSKQDAILTGAIPDSRSSLETASGSGSSRKRVREANSMENGDDHAANHIAMHDDDEEYFDVDMEAQDAYDELEASGIAPSATNVQTTAIFVPYYPSLGGADFDDE